MAGELEQYQENALALCNKLLTELNRNQEDVDTFFGGDVRKAYVDATEKVIRSTRSVRNKIRNL